jgi:hypothetical protein
VNPCAAHQPNAAADLSLDAVSVDAGIWVKGQWKKNYERTFITDKDGSGCLADGCIAKVVYEGKKVWWVRRETTAKGSIGWTKADGQFNCMDAFGGDPACDGSARLTQL